LNVPQLLIIDLLNLSLLSYQNPSPKGRGSGGVA